MKLFILHSLIIVTMTMALVDLGEIGETTQIKEENLSLKIKKKIDNYEISDEIIKKIKKSIARAAKINSSLPNCLTSSQKEIDNYSVVSRDYYDMGGKIMLKKGEKRLVNYPVKQSVCTINGANQEFAKESLKKLLQYGRCDKIMVANADFRIFLDEFKGSGKLYPFNKELSDIAKTQCLPSRSDFYHTKIQITEIATEAIMKGLKQ